MKLVLSVLNLQVETDWKSMHSFLFVLLWDIDAMLYRSSSSKSIVMFACGDLVLDLMKSNLDLKNHSAVLALPAIYLEP